MINWKTALGPVVDPFLILIDLGVSQLKQLVGQKFACGAMAIGAVDDHRGVARWDNCLDVLICRGIRHKLGAWQAVAVVELLGARIQDNYRFAAIKPCLDLLGMQDVICVRSHFIIVVMAFMCESGS